MTHHLTQGSVVAKGARAYETRLTTVDDEVFTAHWIKTEVFSLQTTFTR